MAGELVERQEILVPVTGELVNAADPVAVGQALLTLRQMEAQIKDVKAALTDAAVQISKERLSKTIHLEGGGTVVVKGGDETVYDAEKIEAALRRKKIPEDVIRELVVETVTYKVDGARAKQAAGANEEIAKIIARHKTVVEKRPTIEVKLPPSRARIPAKPPEGAES